jgi:branched-chain amino acid transport system substrate-binding protein
MRGLLAVIAIGLLMAGLAACNPKKDQGDDSGANQAGRQPDFNSGANPIKLGFNLELTGDAAAYGVSGQRGAELALEEINAAGGILGRKVEVVFDDNASQSAQAVQVASKLINQDKVNVIIGSLTSSSSIAIAKLANEAKVPMVSPAATNPAVTVGEQGVYDYVFRACFTDDFQGEGIVDFAVNGPLAAKTAVVFYNSESDYSEGIYNAVMRCAEQKGLKIAAADSYLSKGEQDFRAKLSKFKGMPFDVLIVPDTYNYVAQIASQARELGLTQPLLGGDGMDSPDLWKSAGKSIEGSYFTNHYASDDMDPAVQDYITKYKQHFAGAMPDSFSILTYDAVKLVADAITRAGGTSPDALAKALAETKGFKGAAGIITINTEHNAVKKLVVLQITEGGAQKWVYTYNPPEVAAVQDAPAQPATAAPAANSATAAPAPTDAPAGEGKGAAPPDGGAASDG